jgi:hypothetical protein
MSMTVGKDAIFPFVITTSNNFSKRFDFKRSAGQELLRRKSRSSASPSRQHVNHGGGRENVCGENIKELSNLSPSSVLNPEPVYKIYI